MTAVTSRAGSYLALRMGDLSRVRVWVWNNYNIFKPFYDGNPCEMNTKFSNAKWCWKHLCNPRFVQDVVLAQPYIVLLPYYQLDVQLEHITDYACDVTILWPYHINKWTYKINQYKWFSYVCMLCGQSLYVMYITLPQPGLKLMYSKKDSHKARKTEACSRHIPYGEAPKTHYWLEVNLPSKCSHWSHSGNREHG